MAEDVLVVTPIHVKWNELTAKCIYDLRNPTGGRLDFMQLRDGHIEEDDGGRENITHKQNLARSMALSGGYDWILFVEEDMIVPPDAIELLMNCGSPVAYGLYVFRRPPYLWSAYIVMDPDKAVGHPITANPVLAKAALKEGLILDTDGVGFGCTLIHGDVLEKVPFRINYDKPHGSGEYSHSDFYFALDCIEAGIKARMNFGCICGHISPRDEIGMPLPTILWPCVDGEDGAWYKFVDYDHLQHNERKD